MSGMFVQNVWALGLWVYRKAPKSRMIMMAIFTITVCHTFSVRYSEDSPTVLASCDLHFTDEKFEAKPDYKCCSRVFFVNVKLDLIPRFWLI